MANPKLNLGEYELIDNQDGTMTVNHPSDGESFTIDGDALGIPSNQVTEVSIDNYAQYADLVVKKEGPSDYRVIDGEDGGTLLQTGTEAGAPLQSALDNRNEEQTHIHFAPSREYGNYEFSSEVFLNVSSVMVSGSGKNKSQLKLDDGANTNIFRLDESTLSSGAIAEFVGVKMFGNRSNNSSGSGVQVDNWSELQMYRTEIRSFPDYAVNVVSSSATEWNEFSNCWFLDNGTAGVRFSDVNGGLWKEVIFDSCHLAGVSGAPAIKTDGGVIDLLVDGCRLKGSDVIDFDGSNRQVVTSCIASRIDGSYTIRIGNSSNTNLTLIKGNIFHGGNVTNHILTDSNAFDYQITDNRMFGQSGDAISGANFNIGGNYQVKDNVGFTTENSGQATITSGNTTTTFSHGLDVQPGFESIQLTFVGNPGNANKVYTTNTTSSDIKITVDTDPGSDIDIAWRASLWP